MCYQLKGGTHLSSYTYAEDLNMYILTSWGWHFHFISFFYVQIDQINLCWIETLYLEEKWWCNSQRVTNAKCRSLKTKKRQMTNSKWQNWQTMIWSPTTVTRMSFSLDGWCKWWSRRIDKFANSSNPFEKMEFFPKGKSPFAVQMTEQIQCNTFFCFYPLNVRYFWLLNKFIATCCWPDQTRPLCSLQLAEQKESVFFIDF